MSLDLLFNFLSCVSVTAMSLIVQITTENESRKYYNFDGCYVIYIMNFSKITFKKYNM